MKDVDPIPEARPGQDGRRATSSIAGRAIRLVLLAAIAAVLLGLGIRLGREYRGLRREWDAGRDRDVGYRDIGSVTNLAKRPTDWYRRDGDAALIWSGWEPGVGNAWFHAGPDDLERDELRFYPGIGRDAARVIDRPFTENGGGAIWSKIPDGDPVFGLEFDHAWTAYPLAILQKVFIVNDVIDRRPVMVVFNPFQLRDRPVSVYDATVGGRRVTQSVSGYCLDNQLILYDRGTQSLWADRGGAMTAIAGRLKGASLPRIARLAPTDWASLRDHHPDCRLVVGADRSGEKPSH